jgi:hypothetical protein
MIIRREWAMPSKHTFTIPPIAELLHRYVGDGKGWVDPFAGENSPAEVTNDINPQKPTKYHLESCEFAMRCPERLNGVLFDPPYSLEQMKRSYENVGRKFTMRDGQIGGRWTELKDVLGRKCSLGGTVLSFGWNTIGFGKKRGFRIDEILVVCHGGGHNDTLVTVECKIQGEL